MLWSAQKDGSRTGKVDHISAIPHNPDPLGLIGSALDCRLFRWGNVEKVSLCLIVILISALGVQVTIEGLHGTTVRQPPFMYVVSAGQMIDGKKGVEPGEGAVRCGSDRWLPIDWDLVPVISEKAARGFAG